MLLLHYYTMQYVDTHFWVFKGSNEITKLLLKWACVCLFHNLIHPTDIYVLREVIIKRVLNFNNRFYSLKMCIFITKWLFYYEKKTV